jgi:hypothetical protein
MLANSDDLVGGLYRMRTCDTLIRSNAAIFQGFGPFFKAGIGSKTIQLLNNQVDID